MRSKHFFGWTILLLQLAFFTTHSYAQKIDRLTIGYDWMYINRIHFKDGSSASVPGLYRNFLHLQVKKGPFTVGAVYQITRGEGFNARADEGLMITSSYEHFLSYSFKTKISGRLGVSPGVDYGNILYPTDTDVQIQLSYYNPDGHGFLLDYPLFPSGYSGVIINRFGRIQAIAGAGTFWRGLNIYITGFYAINGVSDPRAPSADQTDIVFGFLNNSGISGSVALYLEDWLLGVRHNFPIFNSGNEWVFSLQYTFHYD